MQKKNVFQENKVLAKYTKTLDPDPILGKWIKKYLQGLRERGRERKERKKEKSYMTEGRMILENKMLFQYF